jgi:hypothetical protein
MFLERVERRATPDAAQIINRCTDQLYLSRKNPASPGLLRTKGSVPFFYHSIMRALAIFSATTLVTFGLMLAANILVLPVAFDTQGTGWSAAPFRSLAVSAGNLLQRPLDATYAVVGNGSSFGIVSIGMLSIIYGAGVAGIQALWHRYRRRGCE